MKFIMLVGIPGSGKSTFAEELHDEIFNSVIVSSDAIREEFFGDASVQSDAKRVFAEMEKRTKDCLMQGISVIYDATNIAENHRSRLLNKLKEMRLSDITFVCYRVECELETAIARQFIRDRVVPENVIRKMHLDLQEPSLAEGWDEIYAVYNT